MPKPTASQCSTSAAMTLVQVKNQNAATAAIWNSTMNTAVIQLTVEETK